MMRFICYMLIGLVLGIFASTTSPHVELSAETVGIYAALAAIIHTGIRESLKGE